MFVRPLVGYLPRHIRPWANAAYRKLILPRAYQKHEGGQEPGLVAHLPDSVARGEQGHQDHPLRQ